MKKMFLKEGVLWIIVSELKDEDKNKLFVESLGKEGVRDCVSIEDQYLAPISLKKDRLGMPSAGFEENFGMGSITFQSHEDYENNKHLIGG